MELPTHADARCWQCGALANPKCAYSLLLVADARRCLEAFDYPVVRGRWEDKLKVSVPRCAGCQSRTRVSIAIIFGSAFVGAIIAPVLRSIFWPHLEPPSWLKAGYWAHEGVGGPATGVGIVLGFLVALAGVALQDRRLHLRSVTDYPPVPMLRQAGWDFPSG